MKYKINNIIIISYAILVCLPLSRANDVSFLLKNYSNESLLDLCENNMISLNFENSKLDTIGSDFISSPFITCVNLTNNHVISIERNAFRKLPNLTILFLNIQTNCDTILLDGHENLKVLIMNNYRSCNNSDRNSYNSYDYNSYERDYYYERDYKRKQIVTVKKYQNLEILSLSENYINDLEYSLSYKSYDLMSPELQDVPFPKLRILDLSKNKIRENNFVTLLPRYGLNFLDLHENLLKSLKLNEKGKDVYTLILDNNEIEYVMWQSNEASLDLIGMTTLIYLSISNNRINTIQSNAFKDANRLEFLNLSRNAINTLYRDTFAILKYLNTVDLSFNQITNVPQFSDKLNISTMFLHHNQINEITSNAFVQIPKLKKLLLGDNNIERIDNKAFAQLSVLEELDLSKNNLSFMPEKWTESLVSLEYLDLKENKFTSLESLSLTNMIPLIDLYLMKNSLEYLKIRYLDALPQNLTVHLLG